MKYKYILFFMLLLMACKQERVVQPTFYFWKTVYTQNKTEQRYISQFKSNKLYMRMMDVDLDANRKVMPVAPITFKDPIPPEIQVIPVVFVVNEVLKNQSETQLEQLAHNILYFVKEKVLQAGKKDYDEVQIDCDWTQTTRDSYFALLKLIKKFNADRKLSVTLRLHQLKNQAKSGIPPADKVVLMCYNMGNLRQFGSQNSILDVNELKKYVNENLSNYPMVVGIALPLFAWSVVFDGTTYAGISKRTTLAALQDKSQFNALSNGLYQAKMDLPKLGIKKNYTVRYEESKLEALKQLAGYLTIYLPHQPTDVIYYHLDEEILKKYPYHELEEINRIFR